MENSTFIQALLLLIAFAVVADVANSIVTSVRIQLRMRKPPFSAEEMLKRFSELNQGGYMVTKVWYSDGHRSSEVVEAGSAAKAYASQSDDRRNLDYYIESVKKI